MKFKTIISRDREEEVLIYAHERTELIDEIERIITGESNEIIGYRERESEKLSIGDIECFTVEDNKVFALTSCGKYSVKQRLYQLEELYKNDFIKINQSCLANLKAVKKFNTSLTGSLMVIFKSGYTDYVSRRNFKKVKERLGL